MPGVVFPGNAARIGVSDRRARIVIDDEDLAGVRIRLLAEMVVVRAELATVQGSVVLIISFSMPL